MVVYVIYVVELLDCTQVSRPLKALHTSIPATESAVLAQAAPISKNFPARSDARAQCDQPGLGGAWVGQWLRVKSPVRY